jgi:hypothetical protein
MHVGGTGLSDRHKDGGSGHQCAPGTVKSDRELVHYAKVSYRSLDGLAREQEKISLVAVLLGTG